MSTQQPPYTETTSHRCYIGVAGVTIYNTDHLDDPEDSPHPHDGLLFLSPTEAIQLAHAIFAQEQELQSREPALNSQYEQVSQALIQLFPKIWEGSHLAKRSSPHIYPDYIGFDHLVHSTFTRLVLDQMRQWYESTFSDRFSHELHEALFWRYFNRHHRDEMIEKYLPYKEEDEEEEEPAE